MSLYPPYKPATWKFLGIVAACVVGLLLLWFTLTQVQSCRSKADINAARANVNAALAEANTAKGTVANDRVDEAVALEKVKQAANDVITASNSTDQARAEANRAVANYEAAKRAGIPTGTTEDDLRRKLEALDQ